MNRAIYLPAVCLLGCLYSSDNREGLEVSCAELAGRNACQDGIITSCQLGVTQYRVCDDAEACTQDWQEQGRFRCDVSEGLPDLMLTSGGSGGAGGALGSRAGGAGGDPGSSVAGAGGTSGIGPNTGCSSAPCAIADTAGYINSVVADSTSIYFASANTIHAIPKAGGIATEVAEVDCASSGLQLAASATYLYATCRAGVIVRIDTASGRVETLDSSATDPTFIAATGDIAYWSEEFALMRYDVGYPPAMNPLDYTPGRIVLDEAFVYWARSTALARQLTSGGQSQRLELGERIRDFTVRGSMIVVLYEDRVVSRDLSTGEDATLGQVRQGAALAVQGDHVYWAGEGRMKAALLPAAGEPVEIGSNIEINDTPTSLIADEAALFWPSGTRLYKLELPW